MLESLKQQVFEANLKLVEYKLVLFTWDGSNDTAQSLLSRLFPGSTICDNCNGTVTIHPVSALQSDQKIYPLPAGVRVIIS